MQPTMSPIQHRSILQTSSGTVLAIRPKRVEYNFYNNTRVKRQSNLSFELVFGLKVTWDTTPCVKSIAMHMWSLIWTSYKVQFCVFPNCILVKWNWWDPPYWHWIRYIATMLIGYNQLKLNHADDIGLHESYEHRWIQILVAFLCSFAAIYSVLETIQILHILPCRNQ